jgi:hypothetical protein
MTRGPLAAAKRFLSHRSLPAVVAAVAVALSLPGLGLGLQLDDHVLRVALTDPPPVAEWSKGPANVFAFFEGDPETNREFMDAGFLPWWARRDFRVTFFRPLAGLTHWIDFRLWPGRVEVMHVHSLLWFGAFVVGAAVLFRRVIGPTWVAGLAAVLFAVDDGHGPPAVWLANRNASIAAGFGVLALLAHDRWRRSGSGRSLVLSIVALAVALMGSELGIATAAYLFAYAVCLDTGPWRRRMISLAPASAVCAAWALTYWSFGFGVTGSALYVDPAQPAQFAAAVAERAPILLFGQWFLPADLYALVSQSAARVFWLAACALGGGLAVLLAPLLRRDRIARFFGLGMVLSLVPACGTYPSGRLLVFASLGGAGLLAQFLAARVDGAPGYSGSPLWRAVTASACAVFVVLHLVLAPVGLAQAASYVEHLGSVVRSAGVTLPSDPAVARQTAVLINTPSFFVSSFGPMFQLIENRPVPQRMLILAAGVRAMCVERPAQNALVIKPAGGFLVPPASLAPGEGTERADFDVRYIYEIVDGLYRDTTPFRVRERVELSGLAIEVTAITGDARPAEVTYHFETALEDPSWRWLQWRDGAYVPFAVPRVGEAVYLPPAEVPGGPWGRYGSSPPK